VKLTVGVSFLALLAAGCASHDPTAWRSVVPATQPPWPAGPAVEWAWTAGTAQTDWITHVIETRDGDLVGVGFVNRSSDAQLPTWDAVAVRFRRDGGVRWSRTFGGPGVDAFWDVREAADGKLVIAGFTSSAGAGKNDAWLVVLDREGRLEVARHYGGAADDLALAVVPVPGDGYLVVGQTESEGAGERDVLLVRTDAGGHERWRRTHGGPGVDRAFFGVRSGDGFVVAGVTGTTESYDNLTLAVDANGAERWRSVVGGPGNDPNHGLSVLPDGRILVTGYTESWEARGERDLFALTYSPGGELLRHEVMGGPGDDRVMSAVTGPDGASWLLGYTKSFGPAWDVMVARVGADGGFEPWMAAVGTPHDDHAYGGFLTGDGRLLVGGYRNTGAGQPPDLLVARLAPDALVRRHHGVEVRRIR
jgi:hypothetical protein